MIRHWKNAFGIITTSVVMLCPSYSMAEIFGGYRGMDDQIWNSTDIVVVKRWKKPPPPPTPSGDVFQYDPTVGTKSTVIYPYDVEIVGVIKGNHVVGTTMTMGLGSFTVMPHNKLEESKTGPVRVVEDWSLKYDTVYLAFMEAPRLTMNRTYNMLHVKDGEPLSRKSDESVKQAITRITGLEK